MGAILECTSPVLLVGMAIAIGGEVSEVVMGAAMT